MFFFFKLLRPCDKILTLTCGLTFCVAIYSCQPFPLVKPLKKSGCILPLAAPCWQLSLEVVKLRSLQPASVTGDKNVGPSFIDLKKLGSLGNGALASVNTTDKLDFVADDTTSDIVTGNSQLRTLTDGGV